MRAVDATLAILKRAGVNAIFGLPGGPVIPLFDALHDDSDIRTFLVRHEQGAGHMAEGYAKVTGKVGVCTATSGPGATNLVTPIADAYMDSVPLLALTGQVGSTRVGTDAFQEADIVGITLPIVKHSYLVKDADELPQALMEAIHIAETGRPGPVLVDVCVDQWSKDVAIPDEMAPIPGYQPPLGAGHARQLAAAARVLAKAERPVIYAGGGVVTGEAAAALTRFAEVSEIPVNTTLMGLGGFPGTHRLFVGMPGMHGIAAATKAFQESDAILAVGVRFDERVLSTVMNEWAPHAKIIHIDVDPAEISKNRAAHIGVAGAAAPTLEALTAAYERIPQEERHDMPSRIAWRERIDEWKRQFPYHVDSGDSIIQPQHVIQAIYKITRGQAIICTDVGQHQMWAAQHYLFDQPRRWVTSGGLGTMGFGLPSAIGAQVALPNELVVDIAGDGSFEMTLQELSTVQMYGLPIKIVILNNGYLGMVRQWQELFWEERYAATSFAPFQPSFAAVAAAYGIPGTSVEHPSQLEDALAEALLSPGPALVDVHVNPMAKVFPMVPQGKGPDAMIVGTPTTGG
ncbi:MAG: biosynthetic-type acetolactate synthase large subunit [Actinomycetota bacterium]